MKKSYKQLHQGDLSMSRIRYYSQLGHSLKSQVFTDFIKGVVSSLFARIQRYHIQKRMLKELDALDEHLLRDIGLSKNDIVRLHSGDVVAADLNQSKRNNNNVINLNPASVSDSTLAKENRRTVKSSSVCEQSVAHCA